METSMTRKCAIKTKERKANNQASFGCSLLENNMKMEAAMPVELSLQSYETGLIQVCTIRCCRLSVFVVKSLNV